MYSYAKSFFKTRFELFARHVSAITLLHCIKKQKQKQKTKQNKTKKQKNES